MRLITLLCAATIAVLHVPADAEWLSIGSNTTGSEWSIDFDRMKSVGGKRHTWVQVDHSKDRTVAFRKSMRLISFDCAANTYKMLSYVQYDSYGKIVDSANQSDGGYGYEPIVPETMAEATAQYACLTDED